MMHPGSPHLVWIPISFTMMLGGSVGLLGGLLTRLVMFAASLSVASAMIDILLGGGWWTFSAFAPGWGFPGTFLRSALGAFILPVLPEATLYYLSQRRT